MAKTREEMLKRVQQLLAKAHDEASTEAERELFEEKAIVLMLEHGIADGDLKDPAHSNPDDVRKWTVGVEGGNASMGFIYLAHGVCQVLGGAMFYLRRSPNNSHYDMTIYASNRRWAEIQMWYHHFAHQLWQDLTQDRPRSRKSYAVAWATRACRKFKEFHNEKAQDLGAAEDCWLPARRTAKQVMEANHPNLDQRGHVRSTDSASYAAGSMAGAQAKMMHKGIQGGAKAIGGRS